MSATKGRADSLQDFSPYRDENGQGLTDNAADRARQDDIHGQLMAEPTADAETARLASGFPSEDATEATEAAVPAENIARISDPTFRPKDEASDAIDRATSGLGQEGGR